MSPEQLELYDSRQRRVSHDDDSIDDWHHGRFGVGTKGNNIGPVIYEWAERLGREYDEAERRLLDLDIIEKLLDDGLIPAAKIFLRGWKRWWHLQHAKPDKYWKLFTSRFDDALNQGFYPGRFKEHFNFDDNDLQKVIEHIKEHANRCVAPLYEKHRCGAQHHLRHDPVFCIWDEVRMAHKHQT
ncbi:hypothetical protein EJ08DRAFT_698210 [Tothia fuscella]|uniref:Uncharacterized protein n=1 Tax=Tothia fuscella TaxID=1048955 RepID=A0A9P4NP59_9PEZI|nr:hypothetical protein EJ08DRAFT_698210 [Tothia fuscella]